MNRFGASNYFFSRSSHFGHRIWVIVSGRAFYSRAESDSDLQPKEIIWGFYVNFMLASNIHGSILWIRVNGRVSFKIDKMKRSNHQILCSLDIFLSITRPSLSQSTQTFRHILVKCTRTLGQTISRTVKRTKPPKDDRVIRRMCMSYLTVFTLFIIQNWFEIWHVWTLPFGSFILSLWFTCACAYACACIIKFVLNQITCTVGSNE